MYNCSYCNYESNYKYNTERHMQTQHKKKSTPSAQHVLGTGNAQDNQTVSIQEYNKIIEETYKWKDAYERNQEFRIEDGEYFMQHITNLENLLDLHNINYTKYNM